MAGEKQMSDPRQAIKQEVGGRKAKEYNAGKLANKGGGETGGV